MKFGRYLSIFLLVMALLFIFGNNGLIDNLMMKQKLHMLRSNNSQLAQENNLLKKEISLLRNNSQYIESLARSELGMVRRGELIYKFSD